MLEIILVKSNDEYIIAQSLFREYANWLNIDLGFQQFEEELINLSGMYAFPYGGIILCRKDGEYAGCIAIRKIDAEIAELKRTYVKPSFQKQGIGNKLLAAAIDLAVNYKYKKIRLDTLSNMTAAINLYTSNGFYEIPAYYHNPEKTAVYFEKIIAQDLG